jgi:FSR family fosmidomycin resistance protein-like MFS transporter
MAEITSPASLEIEESRVEKFQTSRVLTVVSAHFFQDTYSAFLAPLLPSLIEKLSLTYTQAGSLSAVAQLASILNPLIGYLDDKVNLQIFIILAPAITATTMSCLGIAPTYISLLVLLFITGICIATFHAIAPAMVARVSGQQIGRGMSFFMAAGELGRTVAPLLISWALLTLTLGNLLPIAIPGWIASLIIYLRFRGIPIHVEKQTGFMEILPTASRLYLPLFGVAFFRSFLITGMGVYLPTLLTSEGSGIWKANLSLSIYQLAGVLGAFLGGTVSDRLGRKPVLFTVSLLAPIAVLIFLNATGWVLVPVLIIAGVLGLSSQPIILAIVQDHLPKHRSVGNGLIMAINFICLIIAAQSIGILADRFGLQETFIIIAFASLVTAPIVLLIPSLPSTSAGSTPSISGEPFLDE